MLKSMTGFGRARHACEEFICTIEIKSVNHRFLDAHLRLPAELSALEIPLKRLLQTRIKRGRLDLMVNVERTQSAELTFNPLILKSYIKALEELRTGFGVSGEIDLIQLLRVPGVLNLETISPAQSVSAKLEASVVAAIRQAVEELDRMRDEEGLAIKDDICKRLESILAMVTTIRAQAQGSLIAYQERLRTRLNELLRGSSVEPARLVQEAAFYVERSDIAEEITRLESHVEQCQSLMDQGQEVGKTLDFLLQEMNREANTVLSKTTGLTGNALEIVNAAIGIKTEVEKIREQAQNIE